MDSSYPSARLSAYSFSPTIEPNWAKFTGGGGGRGGGSSLISGNFTVLTLSRNILPFLIVNSTDSTPLMLKGSVPIFVFLSHAVFHPFGMRHHLLRTSDVKKLPLGVSQQRRILENNLVTEIFVKVFFCHLGSTAPHILQLVQKKKIRSSTDQRFRLRFCRRHKFQTFF